MVGDCLQGQLSRHLLGESIPVGEINFVNFGQYLDGQKTKTKMTSVGTIKYSVPRKYLQNKISTSETGTFSLKWVFALSSCTKISKYKFLLF